MNAVARAVRVTFEAAHRHGDLNNAILAAVGYNFRRLIKWLRILLCFILMTLVPKPKLAPA